MMKQSLYIIHTHTKSLSLSHTHIHTHSLSHTHTHIHTHIPSIITVVVVGTNVTAIDEDVFHVITNVSSPSGVPSSIALIDKQTGGGDDDGANVSG